jgi:hypothetical protein
MSDADRQLAERIAVLLVEANLKEREAEKVLDLAGDVYRHHRHFGDGVAVERQFTKDAQV